ncbi:MMPL family transporter [Actinoalloteichus sp. AHMU CJ021]|uniref:Drug exporter of the RND superfamily n=1 Tax=Actinoalloteichus caeruleus DSM 43889 TaxID=1120930 RepID=A0ABT1JLF0_ACTCY|nr:MMPL family transporter [Actinoalloteichus caeruleus]AUS78816.1 MMPL family transporter [Actinoalloteichus sp. AHMU CJ021]MCP2332999.1 putative drug exporter of the RND superfamily [Actinoalloteichus caeruleus DSM 43889]
MFARWGVTAFRGRWAILITVLVITVAGGVWGTGVFGKLGQGGYEDPNSEAVLASDLAEEALNGQAGDVIVVYTAPAGSDVDDPEFGARITDALDELPPDAVTSVTSYWQTMAPQLRGEDGRRALAIVGLAGEDANAKMGSYDEIRDLLDVEGVRGDIAGGIPMEHSIEERAQQDLIRAEIVSLPIVLILLLVVFGGVVAAALPVLVGGLAVFGSLGLLHLISLFTNVNVFAVNVASLLGLGLAIDYGLFVVGRFREEIAAGRSTADAVRRTIGTAGRTVAFSATLLVIALAGLMLFPQEFLKSLAYGGMSAVGFAAVVSLTLLPAMLALLGPKVDALPMPWRKRAERRPKRPERDGWGRLADRVMRRPTLIAVPIVAGLVLLGAPFLSTQFGQPDERILPEGDAARVAVETLKEDFPFTSGDGIEIVIQGEGDTPPDEAAIGQFVAQVDEVGGIEGVQPSGAARGVVVLTAQPVGDTFGDEANQAVRDIRALEPPAGSTLLVGGMTALNLDSLDAVGQQLPLMALLIVGATVVLMFLAFGSVLLPIKAVLLSVLSLSATFGVLTWVFVDGHGAGLLGVTPMPMEAGIIVLMAAVVFGLSTDYEVFLLSRMVEARSYGATTEEAVRTGLARTGRVITAAALLLIVVTGAFAFSGLQMMRFIGVGMILALALDATIVRMLLVPALMKLLGNAGWWAPGPLRRLQQRVGIHEGGDEPEPSRGGAAERRADGGGAA